MYRYRTPVMSVQQQRRPVPVTTRTGTGALLQVGYRYSCTGALLQVGYRCSPAGTGTLLQVGYRYKIDLLPYDPTSLREPAQQMLRARQKLSRLSACFGIPPQPPPRRGLRQARYTVQLVQTAGTRRLRAAPSEQASPPPLVQRPLLPARRK